MAGATDRYGCGRCEIGVSGMSEMSGISRVSQNRFGASECAFKHTQRYGEPHENRIMEDTT